VHISTSVDVVDLLICEWEDWIADSKARGGCCMCMSFVTYSLELLDK
jgi:hypothetical protein